MSSIVGRNIKKYVSLSGLKQAVVAERSGFTPQEFSDMINGRKIIKAVDIIPITAVLGIEPNALFELDNPSSKEKSS